MVCSSQHDFVLYVNVYKMFIFFRLCVASNIASPRLKYKSVRDRKADDVSFRTEELFILFLDLDGARSEPSNVLMGKIIDFYSNP